MHPPSGLLVVLAHSHHAKIVCEHTGHPPRDYVRTAARRSCLALSRHDGLDSMKRLSRAFCVASGGRQIPVLNARDP